MTISIVIPALDSPLLPQVLAAIEAQSGHPTIGEIVVAGRETRAAVLDRPRVRRVPLAPPFPAAVARNAGAEASQGELIVFLDSDVLLLPGALEALARPLLAGEAEIVCGGVAMERGPLWQTCGNLISFGIFSDTSPREERDYLPTMFLGLRRETWERLGRFDTTYRHAAGEDVEWTLRARRLGMRLLLEPAARCHHRPPRTSAAEALRKMRQYGASWGKVYDDALRGRAWAPRYADRGRIEQLVTLVWAGRRGHTPPWWPLWLQVWAASVAARDVLIRARRDPGLLSPALLPALALLQCAWYQGLLGYLRETRQ